jgi:hypothetical protein
MPRLYRFATILVALFLLTGSFSFVGSAQNGGGRFSDSFVGVDICVSGSCGVSTLPSPVIVSVQGSFVVPKMASCPPSGLQYANYIVRIDFRNGGGVQFGCDQFPFFFAIVYQQGTFMGLGASYPVQPGDHISVHVTYSRSTGKNTVMMHDATHVWTYESSPFDDSLAVHTDAEFELSRNCATSACPIPHFDLLKTSNDFVTVASGATVVKGSIGHWESSTSSQSLYATEYGVFMTDSDTGNTLASINAISNSGTNFGIFWVNSV